MSVSEVNRNEASQNEPLPTASSQPIKGTSKVIEKLEKSVARGDYYEAHQMYRTLYFRMLGQNKIQECIQLLVSGSTRLLECGQETSGADLASLLLKVYTQSKISVTPQSLENIVKILNSFSHDSPVRQDFIQHAIKWTHSPAFPRGDPSLHHIIGLRYSGEHCFQKAQSHLLLGTEASPTFLADMLVNWSLEGFDSERDLFVARPVLQYLCLGNLKAANILFENYTRKHPIIKNPPFRLPLLNFIQFLLSCCERDAAPLFKLLCEKYSIALKRDPLFGQYLEKIGQIFFSIRPQQAGFQGVFANLFSGMFGDPSEQTSSNSSQLKSIDLD
eukprot:Sdes_comp19720_c0_seq1m11674